ncbi:nitroreductase [Pedobacter sp. BAL39]|uniref:NAD(P)H-dependent oxidoreductase n=1 Tax=Pedobacter sp. BAL39 TaxID=391596 RepID=UPI0001559C0D|nr:NAD(P)H-dependent oxidoreductase [Pedobacter sp. BAL39]EDM36281.1 nitroreductase [Pedobacter sp. BAL39]
MKTIENLKWRYAVKKFNTEKVSTADLNEILEATNLSASSTGIQPYRVFVVENTSLRQKLGEGSFNAQIAESSHLLVFAAFDKLTQEHIDAFIAHLARERNLPEEALADYKAALVGGLLSRADEENFNWSARQAYIALGTALVAAAELKIDSTPMEGFDSEKFDSLLGLKEKGLKSVVTLALGYRDAVNDAYAAVKKVRLPIEEFATFVV